MLQPRQAGALSRVAVSASIALAVMALPLAAAARAEPPMHPKGSPEPPRFVPGTLTVTSPPHAAGTVFMRWEGTIAHPMADRIEGVFQAFKASRRRFVLILDSGGGSVAEGHKVITVLRLIRRTHTLDTSVGPGLRCGSMCVPVYLQGETRFGARTSSWLFHEVTRRSKDFGKLRRVTESSRNLIQSYWYPAGVSRTWIERMLREQDGYDWWQTGGELIDAGAGIITRPIENRRPRNLEVEKSMPPAASAPAATPPAAKDLLSPPTGMPISGALPQPAPEPAPQRN
jgi:hypothetical protein